MESVEEVLVRYGEEQDYADVEEIMQQVQKLHTRWRPDIYKDVVPILSFDTYMSFLKENQVIVAWVDGKVVGLLIYVTRNISGGPMRERKVLFVDSMAVDEAYRGKGIGHKLFAFARLIYTDQGYDGFELQVNAKNQAARAMYEKYGFTAKSINMELLQ